MAYLLYHYNPSLVAAIIFVALFSIVTLMHSFTLIRKRTWYFIPFVIGGFFELVGYVGRAMSAKESPDWTTGPYIMQSLLLLLAPALFAASIYMILGRIIVLVDGQEHSPIRVSWLTKIFVTGDVLSFFVQAGGGGMLANADSQDTVDLGQKVIIGGLVLQILFFGLFIVASCVFHYRISFKPTTRSRTVDAPWNRYLWVLYGASALIMVRNLFRVVEYAQGQDGYLLSTETWLYVFDASLMFVTMALFVVWHPSRIISGKADSVEFESYTRAGDDEYGMSRR